MTGGRLSVDVMESTVRPVVPVRVVLALPLSDALVEHLGLRGGWEAERVGVTLGDRDPRGPTNPRVNQYA